MLRYADFVACGNALFTPAHNAVKSPVVPVQERSTPPFEGFSERVTDGSDDDRTVAYGRWLKRLRQNQSDAEGEDASADQVPDEEAR